MHKKLLSICLSLLLALSLALATVGCGSTPEENAENPVQTPISILQNKVTSLESRMAVAESKVANIPNTSQLRADLDSQQREINALETENQDLQSQLDDLKARLAELEQNGNTGNNGDVDPEDAVETDVRYFSAYVVTVTPGNAEVISIPVRLKLDNQLAVDIEDVVLSARVTLRSTTGSLVVTNTNLIGDLEWYSYGTNSFESWSDIELDASTRESYQLTYSAVVANDSAATANITSIIVSMRFECEDYEIAR